MSGVGEPTIIPRLNHGSLRYQAERLCELQETTTPMDPLIYIPCPTFDPFSTTPAYVGKNEPVPRFVVSGLMQPPRGSPGLSVGWNRPRLHLALGACVGPWCFGHGCVSTSVTWRSIPEPPKVRLGRKDR